MSHYGLQQAESTGDWRTLVRAAVRFTGSGDLRRADRLLRSARRINPRQPEVLLALGRLRARQGIVGEAEELLREAWQTGGRLTAAAAFARFLAHQRGRIDDSLAVLGGAEARNPKSVLLECVRGEVLLAGEDFYGARDAFDRALAMSAGSRVARIGLARVLVAEAIGWIETSEPTRALFLLRRATGLDPDWGLPHRAMAVAFEAIGCETLAARERLVAGEQ
ncbi:MAG: tetratricopeptide repeat protein [Myxococcota bacterium]